MSPIASRCTSILVVHHDPLLCAGIVTALRQKTGFDVLLGDADLGWSDLPPIDGVVADYAGAMRLANAAVRRSQPLRHATRIVALTSDGREGDIRRAIEAGVHGYLLVGGPLSELVEGIQTVASGVRFLCRVVAQRMADSLTHAALRAREMDVLRLVAAGQCNKPIARHLLIEVGTVKSHMSAIMNKLGARSRTQVASIATSRGLVDGLMLTSLGPRSLVHVMSRARAVESDAQYA